MRIHVITALTLAVLAGMATGSAQAPSGVLERISVSRAGAQGNNDSGSW